MAIRETPTSAGQKHARASVPAGRGNPVLLVLAGGLCIAASASFVKLSGAGAGTAAFFRCAIALVVLIPLAITEYRRVGARPLRLVLMDLTAGVALGVDYVFWAASIHDVGASIATVLLNIQVVIFPLLARVISGTALSKRFLLTAPIMLTGVALASGAVGDSEPGSDPFSGAAFGVIAGFAYAGYLFLMRLSGGREHTVHPVCTSTASAAVAAGTVGGLWTGIDPTPGWPAWGWLTALAVLGQVVAWLIMTPALPRLAPNVAAALLLLHPVMAILLGVGIGERPTVTQIGGCALVILAVWNSNRARSERQDAAGEG